MLAVTPLYALDSAVTHDERGLPRLAAGGDIPPNRGRPAVAAVHFAARVWTHTCGHAGETRSGPYAAYYRLHSKSRKNIHHHANVQRHAERLAAILQRVEAVQAKLAGLRGGERPLTSLSSATYPAQDVLHGWKPLFPTSHAGPAGDGPLPAFWLCCSPSVWPHMGTCTPQLGSRLPTPHATGCFVSQRCLLSTLFGLPERACRHC